MHLANACKVERRPNGVWVARCTIQTPGGPILIAAGCPERAIRQAVERVARQMPPAAMAAGWDPIGWTKRAIKKVATKKTLKAIATGYKKVASSPIAQVAVASAAAAYGVPPGATVAAMNASVQLVDYADGPEGADRQKARAKIGAIRQQAIAGDPVAIKAMATLQAAYKYRKAGKPVSRAPGAARILSDTRSPDGTRVMTIHVSVGAAPPEWDWAKEQWRPRAPFRAEAHTFGLRDAYRLGTLGPLPDFIPPGTPMTTLEERA